MLENIVRRGARLQALPRMEAGMTAVRRAIGAAVVVSVALVAAPRASAQNIGATLQGLITDEQHAVLPGVTVVITNTDTGVARTVITDATGWYRAPALQPGNYELRAELGGFLAYVRSGLTLTIGQEPR